MDPEILFPENLVENKHHKLLRSRRRGPLDRDLKPNPEQRWERMTAAQCPPRMCSAHPLGPAPVAPPLLPTTGEQGPPAEAHAQVPRRPHLTGRKGPAVVGPSGQHGQIAAVPLLLLADRCVAIDASPSPQAIPVLSHPRGQGPHKVSPLRRLDARGVCNGHVRWDPFVCRVPTSKAGLPC